MSIVSGAPEGGLQNNPRRSEEQRACPCLQPWNSLKLPGIPYPWPKASLLYV